MLRAWYLLRPETDLGWGVGGLFPNKVHGHVIGIAVPISGLEDIEPVAFVTPKTVWPYLRRCPVFVRSVVAEPDDDGTTWPQAGEETFNGDREIGAGQVRERVVGAQDDIKTAAMVGETMTHVRHGERHA